MAKGILPIENIEIKSDIFAIDVIVSALKSEKNRKNEMDLTFSYLCGSCKQSFPISFVRCHQCYALDSISISETISKKQSQRGYSLL